MTLDVTSFIDSKGGNAEEIRESQRKRGEPVELVDQVIEMYAEWVKSTYQHSTVAGQSVIIVTSRGLRAQWPQQTSKRGPERDRSQEKGTHAPHSIFHGKSSTFQAKEPADDLVAQKKALDAQVEAKRKETRECELLMRQKASNVGNLVAKDVPVSLTEVHILLCSVVHYPKAHTIGRQRDTTDMASRWSQRSSRKKN